MNTLTALFVAQLALPLILIGWMGIAPPRTLFGFCIQLIATAAALWAGALLGIWLLPPWWAPSAFGIALAAVTGVGLRRRWPFAAALPASGGAWIAAGLLVALGAVSAYGVVIALRSRTLPPVTAVNLSFPLEAGTYLIVNGGSDIHTNAHLMTLDASIPKFRLWRGQSYGVDIVRLDRFGLRATGVMPADPKAYRSYGTRVLAPCAGQALLVVDGLPDMPVPEADREHMAGNHVLLRCAEAEVLLGHLRSGSVRVQAGERVAVDDWLGSVGNSGNTGEPHLHLHAQGPGPAGAPLAGDPLPVLFGGRFPVRGDRIESP